MLEGKLSGAELSSRLLSGSYTHVKNPLVADVLESLSEHYRGTDILIEPKNLGTMIASYVSMQRTLWSKSEFQEYTSGIAPAVTRILEDKVDFVRGALETYQEILGLYGTMHVQR